MKLARFAVILLTTIALLHTRNLSFLPPTFAMANQNPSCDPRTQAALAHLESIIYDPFQPKEEDEEDTNEEEDDAASKGDDAGASTK